MDTRDSRKSIRVSSLTASVMISKTSCGSLEYADGTTSICELMRINGSFYRAYRGTAACWLGNVLCSDCLWRPLDLEITLRFFLIGIVRYESCG